MNTSTNQAHDVRHCANHRREVAHRKGRPPAGWRSSVVATQHTQAHNTQRISGAAASTVHICQGCRTHHATAAHEEGEPPLRQHPSHHRDWYCLSESNHSTPTQPPAAVIYTHACIATTATPRPRGWTACLFRLQPRPTLPVCLASQHHPNHPSGTALPCPAAPTAPAALPHLLPQTE